MRLTKKGLYRKEIRSHSNLSIKPFLTLIFTTPPKPKAGTIRPIRAKQLLAQSLATLPALSCHRTFSLLYKSSPSRCNGVLTNCTAAGVKNCAALALLMCLSRDSPKWRERCGAMSGGRLKEAKTVRQSLSVKRAKVAAGTGRGIWFGEPNICVNRLSL